MKSKMKHDITVEDMLDYIGEYVNINIYSQFDGAVLASYDGKNGLGTECNKYKIHDMKIGIGLVEMWVNNGVDFDKLDVVNQIKVLGIATGTFAPFTDYKCIDDVIYDVKEWIKSGMIFVDEHGDVYDECGDMV